MGSNLPYPAFNSQNSIRPTSPPNFPIFSLVSSLGFGLFAIANQDGILLGLAAITGFWFLISLSRYDRVKANLKREAYYLGLQRMDQIKSLTPIQFEHFVGYLFERLGYRVSTTAVTGDQGVDLFINKPDEKAVVQCKRYEGTVGQPILRDLYGTMMHYHADKAYLVTTGTISAQARQWVIEKPIQLIDGQALQSWVHRIDNAFASGTPSPFSFSFPFKIKPPYSFVFVLIGIALVVFITTTTHVTQITASTETTASTYVTSVPSKQVQLVITSQPTPDIDSKIERQLSALSSIDSVDRFSSVKSESGYTVFLNVHVASSYINVDLAKQMKDVVAAALENNIVQFVVFLEDEHKSVNYIWSKTAPTHWTVTSRDK